MHFHVRGLDGAPAHDIALYAETIRLIRAQSDVLVNPTLGQVSVQGDAVQRTKHISRLVDMGLRPDFVPVDTGSTNIDRFAGATEGFVTQDNVYANSVETLLEFIATFRTLGVRPQFISWPIAFTRLFDALAEMHEGDDVPFLLFELTDHGMLGGHPGTACGLLAHQDFLPRRAVEWSVCNKIGNLTAPAAIAIEMGGHVSIGLGDYLYPELGQPTNADLIYHVAGLAKAMGRPVATPSQTSELLKLPVIQDL
ncbi:3-keto-5-aminohexanoate cleavage protein [Roseovarius arcticus]|uniref:3-keto-5-aminohexanoate cleavage protein n=1 Tax=Roseovarius arcticus TaxID=2547404 RepID=UPI003CCC86D2